jgi:chromosome partitioning protein
MITIALCLQKGGVGKTTTALGLGVELAGMGARVLLVDIDPQGNLTQALGYDPTAIENSVYEVLLNPTIDPDFAILQSAHGPDLLPANLTLAGAEMTLASRYGREMLLRSALSQLRDRYDIVLIDTPPSLGLLTGNALTAADTVIVPLQAHTFALKALPHLAQAIEIVHALNPGLAIGGIVVTMSDRRTTISHMIEQTARQQYGNLVFNTVIPFNVRLIEAPAVGQPIAAYAPSSSGAQAYHDLALEVAARYGR